MAFQTFLNDRIIFIVAITGLISGLIGFIKVYVDYQKLVPTGECAPPGRSALGDAAKNPVFSLSLVILVASISRFLARLVLPPLPLHAKRSSPAWKAGRPCA